MDVPQVDRAPTGRSPLRIIVGILIVVVLPLAVGLFLAPRLIPRPKIGLIRLQNDIGEESASEIRTQLAYARRQNEIKAVVFLINSPGGSAAYSEELFLAVWNARDTMPVLASVDLLAASGAYYLAAAADEIYAKPTSSVGSIGVIAFLPDQQLVLEDEVYTSGPFKSFGGTRDGFIRQIEISKFSFLDAIMAGRGDRLVVDPSYLSRAEIWNGAQAAQMGLIDGLMSTDEVINRAAEMAGLADFDVVELLPLASAEDGEILTSHDPPNVDIRSLYELPADMPAGIYYRYVELPNR